MNHRFLVILSEPPAARRAHIGALLIGFVLYALFALTAPGQIAYAAGVVSGTVLRDYNANGVKDSREPGLGGITVTAYNTAGTAVATAATNPVCISAGAPASTCTGLNTPAVGTYTLGSLADGQYRIEFTTTNTGLKPGAFGTGSGTTVQFITVSGAAVTVNASFNSPRDYCQNNPRLVTNCYIQGNQSGTQGVLFSHGYTDNSPTSSPASQQTESQANQIGTTYGLAYRSTTNTLYAAAYLKRNAGFGPGGPGRIYTITPGGAADGTGIFTIPNAGADPHTNYDSGNADSDYDNGAFSFVGKRSLGDIELNADESVLYVVNLNDRSLYSVNLATSVITNHGVIPKPTGAGNEGCNARGEGRPFGLGWRDDLLYVGGVCTAESTSAGNVGTAADLQAYVYTFNPATNSFSSSPVIQFSLNFNRQCLNVGTGGTTGLPLCKTGINRPLGAWRPWRDTFSTIVDIDGANANDTYAVSSGNGGYPMPMLSDIVFDGNDMILGFRDRNGDILGFQDPGPTQTQTSPLLNTTGAGDILRANPNASGGWTIESNSQSNPAGLFGPTTGSGVPQGPGGGEFYLGDNHTNHDETTQGGLAQVPGNGEVVTVLLDPQDLWAGGTSQFRNFDTGSNDDGQRVRSVELYQTVAPPSSPINARFGKANGLGDLEALCNAAPLEIGNRLFEDYNGNGVQDANEPGISGVQVHLFLDANNDGTPDGAAIGTVVTDSSGQYYFSNDTTRTDTSSADYGITMLTPTQRYLIRVDRASDYGSPGGLYLRYLAPANVNSNNSDTIDSDASLPNSSNPPSSGNPATISVLTSGAGANNHTLDMGFVPIFSVGNRIYYDTNNNGQIDVGEVGISGVSVSLMAQSTVIVNGTTFTAGQVVATQNTDGGGYYRFDNLPPGSYSVRVDSSNFTGSNVLAGCQSSGTTVNANTNTTDARDVGIDDLNPSVNGISSNTFTLGYAAAPNGNAPTGEADGVNSPSTLPTTDNRSNLAIDFGFYRLVLTGTVFLDTVLNNGRLDAGETPSGGAESGLTVTLYRDTNGNGVWDAGDQVVATTTTDSTGNYTFTNLPAASNYIVGVALPNNWHSTMDTYDQADTDGPNKGTDDNDNGYGNTFTSTYSRVLALNPGDTATNLGNTVTNSTGTTSNNRVDFGLSQTPTAIEMGGVTAKVLSESAVEIEWETYSELSVVGFNVLRDEKRGGAYTPVNAEPIPAQSPGAVTGNAYAFADTTVSAGKTYFYRVELLRSDDSRTTSDPVKVQVQNTACQGKIAAPALSSPANKDKVGAGKVTLTWNPVECATSYKLVLREGSADGALVAANEGLTKTEFSIKKLDKGKNYYWRVSACSAQSKCTASGWWSFRIRK